MKIFVSIISYRDPLLAETIRSLLTTASGRHEITIGVFEQTVTENSLVATAPELVEHRQVRYKRIDPIYSEGVGWARAINAMQIEDEDFLYQIDSHMVFDEGWDRHLVNDWRKARDKTGSDKVILTGSCLVYNLDENGNIVKHTNYHPMTCKVKYFHFQESNIIGAHGELIERTADVEPAIHICAGNFFVPTQWVKDVGINHKVFFDGEEQLMVLSSFAAGYRMFHPRQLCSYHFLGSGNYVTKQWHEPIISTEQYGSYVRRSIKQLNDFLQEVDEDVLEEYRAHSGVDYINQRLEERARSYQINIPADVIEPFDVKKRHIALFEVDPNIQEEPIMLDEPAAPEDNVKQRKVNKSDSKSDK